MEGDRFFHLHRQRHLSFQSTPSAWRETQSIIEALSPLGEFQSTPSAWRETHSFRLVCLYHGISIHSLRMEGDLQEYFTAERVEDFNPLPPHGGRQECYVSLPVTRTISIHSLRMEGDECQGADLSRCRISIHSLRMEGDCTPAEKVIDRLWISIHSLRMEGDSWTRGFFRRMGHFNPLPPHGGRLTR